MIKSKSFFRDFCNATEADFELHNHRKNLIQNRLWLHLRVYHSRTMTQTSNNA